MKFNMGDKVFHKSKGVWGIITGIVCEKQPRYYLQHSGWLWSVDQKELSVTR